MMEDRVGFHYLFLEDILGTVHVLRNSKAGRGQWFLYDPCNWYVLIGFSSQMGRGSKIFKKLRDERYEYSLKKLKLSQNT